MSNLLAIYFNEVLWGMTISIGLIVLALFSALIVTAIIKRREYWKNFSDYYPLCQNCAERFGKK